MADIIGTDGKDTLTGGEEADRIDGLEGGDSLEGAGGDDTLIGGGGTNTIKGGWGGDLLVGGEANDFLSGNSGNDTIIGGGGDDYGSGRAGDDLIFCGDGDDTIKGGGGTDTILGGAGNDTVILTGWLVTDIQGDGNVADGGAGNDWVGEDYGQAGEDNLSGGTGDDTLVGGLRSDRFYFEFSRAGEGNDIIADLNQGEDVIVLNIADALAADPDLAAAAGDPAVLELADFDADTDWSIQDSGTGKVLIVHPNGSIQLDNLGFGETTDSFVELSWAFEISAAKQVLPDIADYLPAGVVAEPAPEPVPDPILAPEPAPGAVEGNPWDEWLKGTNEAETIDGATGNDVVRGYGGDDTLIGGEGDDTLRGEIGDDVLTGGTGNDVLRIRSGKWGQGDDVITDFELGADKVSLVAADMLEANPGLAAAAGGLDLGLDDLDADAGFSLGASADGDLLIGHQTGSVEIDGIAFDEAIDSFVEIAAILEIEIA